MALKNFSFRENYVGIEVADMKIVFFLLFLIQHGPHILVPKRPKHGISSEEF